MGNCPDCLRATGPSRPGGWSARGGRLTVTDGLLVVLIVLVVVAIVQSYRQHQELVRLIDAFADMTGDMLRETINQVKGR